MADFNVGGTRSRHELLVDKYKDLRKRVFEAMSLYQQKNDPANLLSLTNILKECSLLVDILVAEESCPTYLIALQQTKNMLVPLMKSFETKLQIQAKEVKDQQQQRGVEPAESSSIRPAAKDRDPDVPDNDSRQQSVEATRVTISGPGLDGVAGLASVKSELKKAVVYPQSYPHLFQGAMQPWNIVLLYGPPGTGKTMLAQAVAVDAEAEFYCVSPAELLSNWVGETEKFIRELFQYTQQKEERCIIFIDEVDCLFRQRTMTEHDLTRRIKTQLLTQLNVLASAGTSCMLLCATNCPWELDTAFLRRFKRRIYVPLPDRDARRSILLHHSHGPEMDLSVEDWEQLLDATEGYSGADLHCVCQAAMQEPLNELEGATRWLERGGKFMPIQENHPEVLEVPIQYFHPSFIMVRPVVREDFTRAIANIPRTVDQDLVRMFENYAQCGHV